MSDFRLAEKILTHKRHCHLKISILSQIIIKRIVWLLFVCSFILFIDINTNKRIFLNINAIIEMMLRPNSIFNIFAYLLSVFSFQKDYLGLWLTLKDIWIHTNASNGPKFSFRSLNLAMSIQFFLQIPSLTFLISFWLYFGFKRIILTSD